MVGLRLIFGVFIFAIFTLCLWATINSVQRSNELRAACEAAGGYWFAPRNGEVCLRKGDVIPLPKLK